MNFAIIVAGGRGTRMGSDTPKQFMNIGGHPMLYYSLKAFEESAVDAVVVVTGQGEDDDSRKAYETTMKIIADGGFKKVIRVVCGGEQRYDSCYAGIVALPAGLNDIVLIHDAARPCVTPALINLMINAGEEYSAAVPVTKVKDTIICIDQRAGTSTADAQPASAQTANTPARGTSASAAYTPIDRSTLRAVQTPQAFQYGLVRNAYDVLRLMEDKSWITDDAMVVSRMLHADIKLVDGDENNIKVTTPEDLKKITLDSDN